MSRLLVTGSAGLVGRSLLEALRARGHEVVTFDRRDAPAQDIRKTDILTRAMHRCDGVFHLAAISRVAWGEQNPGLCESVNVAGTESVLRAVRSLAPEPWVVFASSREVYGNPSGFPVREDAGRIPVNVYGWSKLKGEWLIETARAQGMRGAVVRLSNVYGNEHDHPDRAVPALLWRAMQGEDLVLSGSDVFFDFVHVQDCVHGLLRAAEAVMAGDRTLPPIHLVTGVRTSLLKLARLAIHVAGSDSNIVPRPARSFDVSGFYGDPAQALAQIGFRTEVELEDGLRQLRELFESRGRAPDPVSLAHFDAA